MYDIKIQTSQLRHQWAIYVDSRFLLQSMHSRGPKQVHCIQMTVFGSFLFARHNLLFVLFVIERSHAKYSTTHICTAHAQASHTHRQAHSTPVCSRYYVSGVHKHKHTFHERVPPICFIYYNVNGAISSAMCQQFGGRCRRLIGRHISYTVV